MLALGTIGLLVTLALSMHVVRTLAMNDDAQLRSLSNLVKDFSIGAIAFVIASAAPIAMSFGAVCAVDGEYCGHSGGKFTAILTVSC